MHLVLSFFLFSRRLFYEVTERISTKLGHIHLWLLFEKCGPKSPGRLPPRTGAKTLFGTDVETSPKLSLQRNMISTIGKKIVNIQGLTYMPQNCSTLGPQTAGKSWRVFAHPLKFARRMSYRLHFGLIIFARWRLWSTQMPRAWLALMRLRAGRAYAGLCHASSSK